MEVPPPWGSKYITFITVGDLRTGKEKSIEMAGVQTTLCALLARNVRQLYKSYCQNCSVHILTQTKTTVELRTIPYTYFLRRCFTRAVGLTTYLGREQ